MQILENAAQCVGCSACMSNCAFDAISMVPNDEGFLEPVIDDSCCTECGSCQSVCPVASPLSIDCESPLSSYAFVADLDTLSVSSSGGAFSVLAEHFLTAERGVVVGAVLEQDYLTRHRIVDDISDLPKLRLSKYMQSDQGDCFSQIEELLSKGTHVLYVGCPCQVAGLRGFLRGLPTDTLCTVDLICHGAPSPKLFLEYLDDFYGIDAISKVSMRKPEVWSACMNVHLANGEEETRVGSKDPYIRAFLNHLSMRESCYGCQFARMPRQGDITIGDFWNAKSLGAGAPYDKRSSIVVANTEQGEGVWNQALAQYHAPCNSFRFDDDFSLDAANKHLARPSTYEIPESRNRFMKLREQLGFVKAVYNTQYQFDVGLILYMSNNYGSTATNVALYKAIEDLGYSPVVLDSLSQPRGVSRDYIKSHLNLSSKFMGKGDWRLANHMLDTFVIGSDQSLNWNFNITQQALEYLLMCFADDTKNLIGYGVSFGEENQDIDDSIRRFYSKSLSRFRSFSVREEFSVTMCERLFGRTADWVPDPVFLLTRDEYVEIANNSASVQGNPFVFAYFLDPNLKKKRLIERICEQLELPVIVCCDAGTYDKKQSIIDMPEVIDRPDFETWLHLISGASFVLTDSFHGACMSAIMHTPHMVVKARQKERFDNLARLMKYPTQVFFDSPSEAIHAPIPVFDWDQVDESLARLRRNGITWLSNALSQKASQNTTHPSVRDLLFDSAHAARRILNGPSLEPPSLVSVEEKVPRSYKAPSFEVARELVVLRDMQNGQTFLEAQLMAHGAKPFIRDYSLYAVDDFHKYWQEIKTSKRYLVVMSSKGDISKLWKRFLEETALPFNNSIRPKQCFVAILDERTQVLFSEKSKSPILKRCTIDAGNTYANMRKLASLVRDRRSQQLKSVLTPIQLSVHSGKLSSGLRSGECSSIFVNNIECSLDLAGMNIVVIERATGKLADSISLTLQEDRLAITRTR